MSELRAEAINIVEIISEENLEKLVKLLKNFLKEEDNFYSEENQKYLRESIRELEEGRGQEHDLIEA